MNKMILYGGIGTLAIVAMLLSMGIAYAGAPSNPLSNLASSLSGWGIKNLNIYSGGGYSEATGHNFLQSGGVGFTFLNDSGNPAGKSMRTVYFTYKFKGHTVDLSSANSVNTIFVITDPANVVGAHACSGSSPCSGTGYVRLFFQSSLPSTNTISPSIPSCAGPGYNPDNYWWSNPIAYSNITTGSDGTTMNVILDNSQWSNLCGQRDASGFAKALGNVSSIGFAFSSGNGFAHGLWAADGTAPTFTVTNYQVS